MTDIYSDQFYDSYYGAPTFTEVWENYEDFLSDIEGPFTFFDVLSPEDYQIIYYLLYAKYGDRETLQDDLTRWKTKLFSIIYQYGPAWKKEVNIQKSLLELTDTEIQQGSKQIYNRSQAPGEVIDVTNDALIDTVNEQNTSTNQRGKLEGYSALLSLIDTDITNKFIKRFDYLFNPILMNGNITTYKNLI